MSLLVMEFGAHSPAPIRALVEHLTAEFAPIIEVLPLEEEEGLNYLATDLPISKALIELFTGRLASILLSAPKHGSWTAIMIFRPNFCTSPLPLWGGTVDQIDRKDFRRICSSVDLSFAALSVEETVDLDELPVVNEDTFPWHHWRLVEAVVAEPGQSTRSGEIKPGPAFFPL